MSKGNVIAGVVVVGVIIAGGVWHAALRPYLEKKLVTQTEVGLQAVAKEANKGLPKMVDDETQLVSIEASGRTLIYHYVMPNYRATDLNLTVFKDKLAPEVLSKACGMKETRDMFLENGDTLRYEYKDRDGAMLTSLDITLADCVSSGK